MPMPECPACRASEQVPRLYAQGFGDFVNVDEAYVAFTPFHAADVSSVEVTRGRQSLLGKGFLLAEASQSKTKLLLDPLLAGTVHREAISALLMKISPRTLSIIGPVLEGRGAKRVRTQEHGQCSGRSMCFAFCGASARGGAGLR